MSGEPFAAWANFNFYGPDLVWAIRLVKLRQPPHVPTGQVDGSRSMHDDYLGPDLIDQRPENICAKGRTWSVGRLAQIDSRRSRVADDVRLDHTSEGQLSGESVEVPASGRCPTARHLIVQRPTGFPVAIEMGI
jgi:hypothetical protein